MITLSKYEKQWIKLCKGHFKTKYPWQGTWIETMKPLFQEIYGWNPDENNNYNDYLNGLFNKLLDIHFKIQDDQSGSNLQLRSIFNASFYRGIVRDQEKPIERAIAELCGLIQNNMVFIDGEPRYIL